MKKLLLSILVTLLSGCASQVTTLSIPGIERSAAVQVKDLRPSTEKQAEIFSLLISSDAYATYRIADTAIVPSATRVFQHRAFEKFGVTTEPVEIKIHHLVVYRNLQAQLRQGAIGAALGGVLGAVVAGSVKTDSSGVSSSTVDSQVFDSYATTEYKRALYTEQENPGRGSVHVIYMDTEIQGKRAFTKTLIPMKTKEKEYSLSDALELAVKHQLSQY